jgi:hypothetical protein
MHEKLRSLEAALHHMELQMQLHKRVLEKNPDHFSSSFINGQTLIFNDFFPAMKEAKLALEKLKKEELA